MLRRVRILALLICTIFGVMAFGISASILEWAYLDFATALTAGLLVMLICPTVLGIDWYRRGVFTSWTSVELGWMGGLWILSLVGGACAINDWQYYCHHKICIQLPHGLPDICTGPPEPICMQMQAVSGFSIINTCILFALWAWTLYIGVRAHVDGDPFIWTSPAHEYEFIPTFPVPRTDKKLRRESDQEFAMSDRPYGGSPMSPAQIPLPPSGAPTRQQSPQPTSPPPPIQLPPPPAVEVIPPSPPQKPKADPELAVPVSEGETPTTSSAPSEASTSSAVSEASTQSTRSPSPPLSPPPSRTPPPDPISTAV